MKLHEIDENRDLQASILVIVGDFNIRRYIRNALENQGYVALIAATAKDGLTQAEAAKPNLIMLDLDLPDSDGINLVSDLRACTQAPLIVLSASMTLSEEIAVLDMGADDYLGKPAKPFCFKKLLARVRAQLRRPAPESTGAVVEFGDIRVDFPRRLVTKKGEKVHLTPTEFRLVRTLLFNAGKVLTNRYLLREVWGAEKSDCSHYLRTYVVRLRQKLEENPDQPQHILTETGMGYSLVLKPEFI